MRLSASFVLDEFSCHDGTDVPAELVPNVADLCVGVLQPIRNKWGPIVVISGYRTGTWNLRCGGAAKSTHLTGQGADIRPVRVGDVKALGELVEEMWRDGELDGLGGLGKYKGWLHVDIVHAKDGHLRRWVGHGVGSESTED